MDRRDILKLLGAIGASPLLGLAEPGPPAERMPWARFARSAHFVPFAAAITALKGNKEPLDPGSWWFWAGIHGHHCPHGKPYFLAWHRGYLWLFERKLREISGIDTLRLPYWDYFHDPAVPPEFLAETGADGEPNPLWEPRKGAGIGPALSYGAFGSDVTAFQRGQVNAFEAKIEAQPHNNIHNLVGGKMATMQSPEDVLFWLHHANVDRLWSAWIAAGRTMPGPGAGYWNDRFAYADTLDLDRRETMACEHLGYRYADLALPMPPPAPPPPPPPPPVVRAAPPRTGAPRGDNRAAPPGAAAALPERAQITEGGGIALGDESVSVSVPFAIAPAAPPPVRSAPGSARPRTGAAAGEAAGGNRAVQEAPPEQLTIVLRDVALTDAGAEGGYFYKIYAAMPGAPPAADESRLVGTLGPFQIAAAMHQAMAGRVRIELPATDVVRRLLEQGDGGADARVTLSFVRVNAEGAPSGKVIDIGAYGVEGTLIGG